MHRDFMNRAKVCIPLGRRDVAMAHDHIVIGDVRYYSFKVRFSSITHDEDTLANAMDT